MTHFSPKEEFFKHFQQIKKIQKTTNIININEEDLPQIQQNFNTTQNQVCFPFEEGIIFIQNKTQPQENYELYFKLHNEHLNIIYFTSSNAKKKIPLEYDFTFNTGEITPKGISKSFLTSNQTEQNKQFILAMIEQKTAIILSTLIYIEKLSDAIQPQEEKTSVPTKQRLKSSTKKSSKYTYIKRKIYTIQPQEEQQKRAIQRHVESWGVRGHYRTYKNGKTIWIKPHTKGNGKLKQTNYKISPQTLKTSP